MTPELHAPRRFRWKVAARALHWFFLAKRGMTLGVRAVVRCPDGKFLLLRHTYLSGWHFPGGGVERGESVEQALGNELEQETGLELARKPLLHGVFFNETVSQRDHVLVYLCDVKGDISARPTSLEVAEYGFFDPQDLPSDIDPGTAKRIREITYGIAQSETW